MEDGDFYQRLKDLQREYLEFLDDEEDQGVYMEKVKLMIGEKRRRLIVNLDDLRRKNPERAKSLLETAFEEQIAFQKALKEYVSSIDPAYAKAQEEFFVAFSGRFGTKHVTPRSLTSRYLGNLICVEGIVTRVSLVRPKVVRSVHYCPTTKKVMERKYTDLTSIEALPTSAIYPTKDDDGNPLETKYGLFRYKVHQTLTLQEMPEGATVGQLPRSVDVVCDDDLVDMCKPGDRVQVVGNYCCLPNKQGSFTAGRTLIANNVTQINKEMNLNITLEDIKCVCMGLAKHTTMDMFELLSKSLAPFIHGHDYIKKAILCLLVGGLEKILPNGTRLRGDINILLIGDPSVAKSQLLRYVLMTAPRAITTTGRGSSGVGLTAAVTTDPETGDRRLEAGAMVLADRGVVCIDEFDKMSDIDRTAIHEVMEQGRVTIAKAGVHASLNARCAVLAAANPVSGRYEQYKTPTENIGLQDSLLSRFDLLFVMLDTADADHDHRIAEHVLRMHRYRNPKEQDVEVLPMGSSVEMLSTENPDNDEVQDTEESIYEKYDPLLHGKSRSKEDQILSTKFMRKYIHIARLMKPKLTQEACDTIADEYARLRNQDMMDSDVARTQPVTAQTLETLIRLSTAYAKCRLSFQVTQDDALAAIELVHNAYFKKVLTKEKRRKRRASSGDEANGSDAEQPSQPSAKESRQREATIPSLQRDMRNIVNNINNQIAEAKNILMKKDNDLKRVNEEIESLKRDLSNQEQLTKTQCDLNSELQKKLALLEEERQKDITANDAYNIKIEEMNSLCQTLNSDLAKLQEENDNLTKELNDKQETLSLYDGELESFKQQLMQCEFKFNKVRLELNNTKEESQKHLNKILEVETVFANYRQAAEEKLKQQAIIIEDIKKEQELNTSALNKEREECVKLEKELKLITEALSQANIELQSKKDECDTLVVELQNKTEIIEQMDEDLQLKSSVMLQNKEEYDKLVEELQKQEATIEEMNKELEGKISALAQEKEERANLEAAMQKMKRDWDNESEITKEIEKNLKERVSQLETGIRAKDEEFSRIMTNFLQTSFFHQLEKTKCAVQEVINGLEKRLNNIVKEDSNIRRNTPEPDDNAIMRTVLTKDKRRKRRASSGDEANGSDAEQPSQPRVKKSRQEGSERQNLYVFSSDEDAEPVLRAAHSTQPEPTQRTTRSSQKNVNRTCC